VVLRKACESLVRGGLLIVEVQTPDAIEQLGGAEASEYTCETGLFSDKPHHCRTENQWLNDQQVSVQVFTVTETDTESPDTYRSTTKAWSDADLQSLALGAGFSTASHCPQWPCNTDSLVLWSARRGTV